MKGELEVAELDIAGERLSLRPDRSLFWSRARTLVIADPHFGKADAFRAAGVPVPGGTAEPLDRLAAALAQTGAERLVVLGDFWHARAGLTAAVAAELEVWRAARPGLSVALVRGNHDRAGPPPAGWGEWVDCFADPPFVFTHDPDPAEEGYVMAGHLHPGVVLEGRGRDRLRLPCFWFGSRVVVLPAFARFTGIAPVTAHAGDRVFAVASDAVVQLPVG